MAWLFTSPPIAWQWIAGIAGVVALILILPQIIWGAPKIEIELGGERKYGDFTALEYAIYNRPIKSKWLKLMKVKRLTAEGVVSLCEVTDYEDKTRSFKMVPKIQDYTGKLKQRVDIPAGIFSVTVSFLVIRQSGKVHLNDNNFTELTPGGYILYVGVTAEGRIYSKMGCFMVTKEHPYCYWVENGQKTK